MRRFLKRATGYDTAVYWPPIGHDDYGQYTYGTPVEIKCRWSDAEVRGNNTHTARVFTLYPVQARGILLHCKLQEVVDVDNPRNNPGFIEIKTFSSVPDFKNKVRLIQVKG